MSAGDRDAAQDLVDEAFARAWASWRTVSRHPAPAAWVVRTALNVSISRWRRRRREVPAVDLALLADRPAAGGAPAVRSIPGSWRRCSGCLPGSGMWSPHPGGGGALGAAAAVAFAADALTGMRALVSHFSR